MFTGQETQPLQVGCVQTFPYDNAWQYTAPYAPYAQTITAAMAPHHCDGDTHVWGCSHAEKCKCGKATRRVEPPKCGHCGKEHS